jgi:hypothetical protein
MEKRSQCKGRYPAKRFPESGNCPIPDPGIDPLTDGAIIYETGGILIDNGWLRILGSGSQPLNRSLPEWNKGKAFNAYGEHLLFYGCRRCAGRLFCYNGGGISKDEVGKIFYFAPDNLKWESTGLDYANFIIFCFSGTINKFYEGLRWNTWQQDVKKHTR